MNDIRGILSEIEKEKDVRILYACETGSRAWGFPSPDSDYDVRFIYMHKRDWYLSLFDRKDTIEYIDGELDITGWDLKKSLGLLKKSNTPLIERFQSPVTYFSDEGFKEEFKKLVKLYYSPIAVFYHHFSLAQKFQEEMKEKTQVKLKSYFYLIRSLLSCHWVTKDASVLPMDIEGLMSIIDCKKAGQLRELIKLKATVGEKYLHKREEKLDEWIKGLFSQLEKYKSGLGVNEADISTMNEFFLKMVNTNADD